MACLDDNTLLAFAEHALSDGELESVAEHLDSCETCLTIACAIARSEADTVDGASAGLPAEPPTERVGRYALREMIGRGGMGRVYIAHDPQLDREVALKVVRAERFAGAEMRARLSREARAMAKVVHPHVVTVFDAGELDDGVWIAMELVVGHTLGKWLAEAPRTWREVLRVFVSVGRGLAAAHAAGIVHRDFKPDNVLVDRAGRPAVTDFGLALADAGPPVAGDELAALPIAEAMERSRAGALVGTPMFMSPEQFAAAPLDARTDQFSFAIALYDALYHQRPFAGSTLGELMVAVTEGKLRARPARSPVPLRVHRVLERALQTAPADRYATMGELLAALETAARPVAPRVAAGGAVVVLGALGAAWLAHGSPAAPPPPAIAVPSPPAPAAPLSPDAPRVVVIVPPFANTTGEPRLDDTLDVALEDVLYRSTRIDPLAGVELADRLARGSGSADAALAELLEQIRGAGHDAIVVRGAVARGADGQWLVTARAEGIGAVPVQLAAHASAATADDALGAAVQLGVTVRVALGDPPPPGSTAHVLSRSLAAVHAWAQAQHLSLVGDADGQVRELRRALAADAEFVEAHAMLGLAYYNQSKLGDAARELELAARDSDHMPERQRLSLLGDYYGSVGRYEEAIAAYEQSLSKWPHDGRTEINITATAIDAGSFPLALDLARRAVKSHGNLDVSRANLVLADLANEHFDDAVRDGDEMVAALPRPSAFGWTFLAMAHALHGEPDAARATYARLAEVEEQRADGGRADLAMFEGKPEVAEPLLAKWIAAKATTPADASTEQLRLALLRLRRGDRAGAARAAGIAAASEDAPRTSYLAASIAVFAGQPGSAAQRARAWRDRDSADWRALGELLEGDLALAADRPRDAIAAYQRAGRIAHLWLQHERLGRAYLAAKAWDDAERELAWCHDHRGEGAVLMTPSLALLPDAEALLASARARGAK